MGSPGELDWTLPESGRPAMIADKQSRLAVIITHPWGLLGGDMHNSVVVGIAFWFQRLGITTMRFDFVGSQLGRGHIQVQQVQEAANFLLQGKHCDPNYNNASSSSSSSTPGNSDNGNTGHVIPQHILLIGYSYGSIICASASSNIARCVGVIAVAPPFTVRHWLFMFNGDYHLEQSKKKLDLPRLFVLGSKDNFTNEDLFMDIIRTMPQHSTTGAVLKGADHFFRRREKDLMDIVGHWLLSTFHSYCHGDIRKLRSIELPIMEPKSRVMESQISGDLAGSLNCISCTIPDE